ncbi:MAG: PAS domain S-box protein [Blastocatellia bacterium]|nr:PAS domain S-box protein [Blastocatellia bacterium]
MKLTAFRLPALILALLCSVLPVVAQVREVSSLSEPVDLSGFWAIQTGDNPAWAAPDVDSTRWRTISVPSAWKPPGITEHSGPVWFRRELRLSSSLTSSHNQELAIQLEPIWCDAYEVYANGTKIGSYGTPPPQRNVYFPRPLVFRIPAQVMQPDGRLVLAVRTWWDPAMSNTFPRLGKIFTGETAVGDFRRLNDRVELAILRGQQGDLLRLLMPVLYALAGLYHLLLFRSRRQLREYLWFGLMALSIAIATYSVSLWGAVLLPMWVIAVLGRGLTHVTIGLGAQFLWTFLGRPIGRLLGWLRNLQFVWCALIFISPDLVLGTKGNVVSVLLAVPITIWAVAMVVQEAWRGTREARVIGFGIVCLAFAQLLFYGSLFGYMPTSGLYHTGFTLLAFSMMLSLSIRYSRVYQELDGLNQGLEKLVTDRTGEIQKANEQLQANLERLAQARREAEEKNRSLEQSEAKFSKLFRANPIPSVVLSMQGRFIDVNDAALSFSQYSRAEVIGKTTIELESWVSHAARTEFLQAITEGRTPFVFENQFRTRDGNIKDVHVTTELIELGGKLRILAMYYDLTERKRQEAQLQQKLDELAHKNEELRQTEERFSKFFHANPVASVILSLPEGRILDSNRASEKISYYTKEECIGKTSLELNFWEDSPARQKMFRAVLEGRTPYTYEARMRTKTGEFKDIFVSVELVEVGAEKRLIGMFYDITDQKRLEHQLHAKVEELAQLNDQLRDSEEKFSKFFKANPVASVLINLASQKIVEANEALLKLSGYSRLEIIGKTAVELGTWENPELRRFVYAELQAGRAPVIVEGEMHDKTGFLHHIMCSFDLVALGQERFMIGMFSDITERKQLELQLQAKVEELAQLNSRLQSSEEKFSKFFEANPVPSIFISLQSQKILDINQAFEQSAGYARPEIIGKTSLELGMWFDTETRENMYQALREGRIPYTGELRFKTKRGVQDVLASVDLVWVGQEMCIIGMFYDITERKKLESQLQHKVDELALKNDELVASHKQANRIFSALAEALPGTVLDGKYRLDDKIGSGGFGAVFRATHLALNTKVAIKVFRPRSGDGTAEDVERFRREGMSACRVQHPNAIAVLDSGISTEGIAYLVMELLVGDTVARELRRIRQLSLERCARIVEAVCAVLTEAHRIGIIHRDIKPDNIFLHRTHEGEVVKVVDFGIAKFVDDSAGLTINNLTATGSLVGTPTYMAPECLRCETVGPAADVYSVAIMVYEMLCGRAPFVPNSKAGYVDVMVKQLNEAPPPLTSFNPNIPLPVEAVVLAALCKDPAKRPTAAQFALDFTAVAQRFSNVRITGGSLLAPHPLLHTPRTDDDRRKQLDTLKNTIEHAPFIPTTIQAEALEEEEHLPTQVSAASEIPRTLINTKAFAPADTSEEDDDPDRTILPSDSGAEEDDPDKTLLPS